MTVALPLLLAAAAALPPAPPPDRYWTDEGKHLPSATREVIDQLGREADQKGLGELHLVVLDDLHQMMPDALATKLLRSYGVGHPTRLDGVLCLFSAQDGRAWVHLGEGVSFPEDHRGAQLMLQDAVLPALARHDLPGAAEAAARGLASVLRESRINQKEPQDHPRTLALRFRLPNPRPRGWVVNVGGRLPKRLEKELNFLVDGRYALTGNKLFVVTYRSSERWAKAEQVAAWARDDLPLDARTGLLVVSLDPVEAAVVAPGGLQDPVAAAELVQAIRDTGDAALLPAVERALEVPAAPTPRRSLAWVFLVAVSLTPLGAWAAWRSRRRSLA